MFRSATVKLTIWYLLILSSIGLIFSVIIYQVASSEINNRLENIEQRLTKNVDGAELELLGYDLTAIRALQAKQARGNLFTNLVYINLIFITGGGVASYFMARRTLEPIEEAHEAQSRFTSDASHELRTPLAAMKTELEVALRDPKLSKKEMRELLGSNLEEVDKLSKISQSLLLLSRLEHGALPTRRLALDDIVRRIIENSNRKAPRIIYEPPEKPLYVSAHQVSIEELVTILTDNALKYSAAKSKVRVRLKRKNKKAKLEVINAGKGISPEELPYIFDRFFRADQSRTGGEGAGFGLGLSLAKRIVEMHKGDLSVTSHLNKETNFTVLLPLYQTEGRRKQRQSKTRSRAKTISS